MCNRTHLQLCLVNCRAAAAHKVGPAFAGGNTVFLKPHPHGYLSARMLVDACYEGGVPRDAIQLCIPEDAQLRELAGHADVNCVNLTGSVAAGKALAREAGYKKLLFELGGNDPLIVLPDANLQLAAQQAVDGRFGTAGQVRVRERVGVCVGVC